MGRPRTRTWDETTELAIVVETVGGTRWAAAIADLTEETLVKALQSGYLRDSRAVRLLAERAIAAGHDVDFLRLLGSDASGDSDPAPTGTDDLASRRRTYAAPAPKVAEKAPATTVASAQRGRQKKGSRRSSTPYRDVAAFLPVTETPALDAAEAA